MRYTARRDSCASAASALTTWVDFIFIIISKYSDKSMTAGMTSVFARSSSAVARGAGERRGSRHDAPRVQAHGEAAALARLALHIERCLGPVQNVVHDRETETRASGRTRTSPIDA